MKKEKVLEIEFQPVWDKWAWTITKQNEKILERNVLNKDNDIQICTSEEKTLIEEKVKSINEKYGIKKRWRAEKDEIYYCINEPFGTTWYRDSYTNASSKKHENGNYFKTEAEALEYAEYMKQCSLEWHEKRGNNE